jgi:DNA-binding response OmpR family regulator
MGARILVVDDEPDLLELVRVNLAQAGYVVETAVSGSDAAVNLFDHVRVDSSEFDFNSFGQ